MNAHDTLFCLVDLQERLVPVVSRSERIVWNARRLLDGANLLGVAVVATEQYPEKLGTIVEPLASRLALPAASKLAFSSVGCTDVFAQQLERWHSGGRHRVLLAGIETHVCIAQTSYDLMAAGFQVFVAVDATGSRHAVDHETALRRLDSAGVVLTTTEAALFEWCRQAGTPEFKEISAWVRENEPLG